MASKKKISENVDLTKKLISNYFKKYGIMPHQVGYKFIFEKDFAIKEIKLTSQELSLLIKESKNEE